MVRDIQKILETLQEHEENQELFKDSVKAQALQGLTVQQLINTVDKVINTSAEAAKQSKIGFEAMEEKFQILREFVVQQAEESTSMRLRILQLEEKLNAKN
tara:strand:+ start:52 stop:354 length:303 start_codon:yes stop_codon:yes gene_type:complete